MPLDLSGKTAMITGASRGIGAATARYLAKCGTNVVLCARSQHEIQKISEEIGDRALAVVCDVAQYQAVEQAVEEAVSRFGGVDILVNNAGTIDPISRIEDSDPARWGQVVDVNLKGVYHGMRAVYPSMKAAGGGVIVNISSGAASGALEGWSHYCATKAGVLAMTRCGHKEWQKEGIHVVGLSPGTVATDMQISIKQSGVNPVSQIDWETHISPEWVAQAIGWLTTDAAREFDGGDFSLNTREGLAAVGLV